MEISLSKRSLKNVFGLILLSAVMLGGYTAWTRGGFEGWSLAPETPQTSPEAEPALQSLAALYAPSGERVEWEEQVCKGMTEEGCQLFRALFAGPVWESARGGESSVIFIEAAETLTDGSQVWKTEVTAEEAVEPVYIQVAKNDAGEWLLVRVLFAQEAARYEDR